MKIFGVAMKKKEKLRLRDDINNLLFHVNEVVTSGVITPYDGKMKGILREQSQSFNDILKRTNLIFPISDTDYLLPFKKPPKTFYELEQRAEHLHNYIFRELGFEGSWDEKVEITLPKEVPTLTHAQQTIWKIILELSRTFKTKDIINKLKPTGEKFSRQTVTRALNQFESLRFIKSLSKRGWWQKIID